MLCVAMRFVKPGAVLFQRPPTTTPPIRNRHGERNCKVTVQEPKSALQLLRNLKRMYPNPCHENEKFYRIAPDGLDLRGNLHAALITIAGYADYLISDLLKNSSNRVSSQNHYDSDALKRLSELSILVNVANRSSRSDLQREIESLKDILSLVSGSVFNEIAIPDILPAAQLLLCAAPANVLQAPSLLLHPGFRQLYRDPATELCYRHLLSFSRELPSFHWADIESQLLCNTAESPQLLRRCDLYSFTHEIFYLTNFGEREIPSGVNTEVAASIICYHARRAFDLGDDDLLIELLLAAIMCETNLTVWNTMLSTLKNHADERWFVRPNYSLLLANKLRDVHRRRYEFVAQYHPVVVWCLLLLSLTHSADKPI